MQQLDEFTPEDLAELRSIQGIFREKRRLGQHDSLADYLAKVVFHYLDKYSMKAIDNAAKKLQQ